MAEQYARDVLAGKIVAGKYVRLACARHFRDLETGHERGLLFDRDEAQFVLDFFSLLKHSKGKWAGTPVLLEPWQAFIIASVFGWKKADGQRRFRTSYKEVARKNGKSTEASGIGLYGLVADGEAGAEVYTAGTKKDQAKITFDEAVRMTASSPSLRKRIKRVKNNLSVVATSSKMEPIGADSTKQDGLNVHFSIVDELHAHRTSGIYDVLESAMGARSQPLTVVITTAGFDKTGFCYQLRGYAIKVLEGEHEDDSFFAIIYTLDEGDDWLDEANWVKANPNLGISVSLENLRDACRKAREIPSSKVNFLTKHLNLWTDAAEVWVDIEKFDACKASFTLDDLSGFEIFGGLDLANVSDISALVALARKDGKVWVKPFFYLPEEVAQERWKKNQIPYPQWAAQGYITLTPGNICDYNFIKADIHRLRELLRILDIGYDRWNASQLVIDLTEDGAPMTEVGQGVKSMNPAMREFERLYLSGDLVWDGNPVLRWMAGNLMIAMDPAGNMKPDRKNSRQKIDGMAALFDAIARMMANEAEGPSVYETRGIDAF
jgi:phage terminase large subunit-like protein